MREFKAILNKHNERMKLFLSSLNSPSLQNPKSYSSSKPLNLRNLGVFERGKSIIQFQPFFPDSGIPRLLLTQIHEKPYIGKVGKGKLALYTFHFDQKRVYVRYLKNKRFEWLTVALDSFHKFKRDQFDELLPPQKLEERMQCLRYNQDLQTQVCSMSEYATWKDYWVEESETVILNDYVVLHFTDYFELEYLTELGYGTAISNLLDLELFPNTHQVSIVSKIYEFLKCEITLIKNILANCKSDVMGWRQLESSDSQAQQIIKAVSSIVKQEMWIHNGPKREMLLTESQSKDHAAAAFMVFTLDQLIQYWHKDTELNGIVNQDNTALRNTQISLIFNKSEERVCFVCEEENKDNECARCERYFHQDCVEASEDDVCEQCGEEVEFEMPRQAPQSIPSEMVLCPQILRTYEEYIEENE